MLSKKLDANGTGFLAAANAAGYGGSSYRDLLARTLVRNDKRQRIAHFVELHIEQGEQASETWAQTWPPKVGV